MDELNEMRPRRRLSALDRTNFRRTVLAVHRKVSDYLTMVAESELCLHTAMDITANYAAVVLASMVRKGAIYAFEVETEDFGLPRLKIRLQPVEDAMWTTINWKYGGV